MTQPVATTHASADDWASAGLTPLSDSVSASHLLYHAQYHNQLSLSVYLSLFYICEAVDKQSVLLKSLQSMIPFG